MRMYGCSAAALAAWAICGASAALATPEAVPLFTFCEYEENDEFEDAQRINVDDAREATDNDEADDCFFITGKLQKDCAWDCEPKCALVVYGKPVQCFTSAGVAIPGRTAEPLLRRSLDGHLEDVEPVDEPGGDWTLRLGVTATLDAADFTVNGLASNGLHGGLGEVTVKVYESGKGAGLGDSHDGLIDKYVFNFLEGREALRWALELESGESVDIWCCEDTGEVEICWDIDYYRVKNLEAGEPYCVTVVGGLDHECNKVDVLLGEFNKSGVLRRLGEDISFGYSEICTFADDEGNIWFAVSGPEDENFNGIKDSEEADLQLLEFEIFFRFGELVEYEGGASTKDREDSDAVRLDREIWDELGLECGSPVETDLQHGTCGGYCIKVRRGDHVDTTTGNPPSGETLRASDADFDGDGMVNASDLAILLSMWGSLGG